MDVRGALPEVQRLAVCAWPLASERGRLHLQLQVFKGKARSTELPRLLYIYMYMFFLFFLVGGILGSVRLRCLCCGLGLAAGLCVAFPRPPAPLASLQSLGFRVSGLGLRV